MIAWGMVPARGGSKSIPLKNLLPLAGRPLLDYVVRAGQASGVMTRLICSTDDTRIAARAHSLGIEVDIRPATLASDDAKVDDVARDFLERAKGRGEGLPDAVLLLQPTSPFLRPGDIRDLLALMDARPSARSVHNVYRVPHNLHAWNQRLGDESGLVHFPFEAERSRARNKQQKPIYNAFGNLIATRTESLLAGEGFYAKPSYCTSIEPSYAFDLDQQSDIAVAEALIAAKIVNLEHLSPSANPAE
jgi:CMP-N-acetylneuraminic acid synthetase